VCEGTSSRGVTGARGSRVRTRDSTERVGRLCEDNGKLEKGSERGGLLRGLRLGRLGEP
jgi:hypothetical protein